MPPAAGAEVGGVGLNSPAPDGALDLSAGACTAADSGDAHARAWERKRYIWHRWREARRDELVAAWAAPAAFEAAPGSPCR